MGDSIPRTLGHLGKAGSYTFNFFAFLIRIKIFLSLLLIDCKLFKNNSLRFVASRAVVSSL